ncbi:unnamed protein product [Caenorhabditis sp. 36 PRJEB53466]|nr:unnamed protein product [Caenorhabditis sp. 36 PRJEB53466]
MRLLIVLLLLVATVISSEAAVVSFDSSEPSEKLPAKRSSVLFNDVPGQIKPDGATGKPKFVKIAKG